jgi:hypothetical protein
MAQVARLDIDSRSGIARMTIDRHAEGSERPIYSDLPEDMRQALLDWIAVGMPVVQPGPAPVPTKVVGDEFEIPSKLVGDFSGDE